MHKLLIVIGFCLVTFLGVISCYDEHNTFGDRLVDSDLRNIRMDTSSIGGQILASGMGEGLSFQLYSLFASGIFDGSRCNGVV